MDKQWFYTKGGTDKQGPVSERELRELYASGGIKASDLVWCEGMDDWKPIHTISALTTTSQGVTQAIAQGEAALPDGLLSWMGFVGVMTIVGGVLYLCHFFLGVLLIVGGVALMAAKTELTPVRTINANLVTFFDKLKTFMTMMGIFYIATIVLTIVIMIIYFFVFASAIASGGFATP